MCNSHIAFQTYEMATVSLLTEQVTIKDLQTQSVGAVHSSYWG
jgi:hypothetical protein